MRIDTFIFGESPYGSAYLFRLVNDSGMEVEITNYGGIIRSIQVPDRAGQLADVVLGFDALDGYLGDHPYFGALVGRYCNRIAKGKFSIDSKSYQLATNNGPNHLHGGIAGFSHKLWQAETFEEADRVGIELKYLSPDGEEGYPGALSVTARYSLTEDNALVMEYEATTDKPTIINLTNHAYFNLAGQGDILDHKLKIKANEITPVDEHSIPTGECTSVVGTPFDFRSFTPVGLGINAEHALIQQSRGYDQNFVIDRKTEGDLELAATLHDPSSGRKLEIFTTEPGVQLYTSNFFDGTLTGKAGTAYQKHEALCLETQHFPDSPNQPSFPSTVLRPGEVYRSRTDYRFASK
ncbi:MAG: aldose epimerase family protein [Bacteroidota bacterium]